MVRLVKTVETVDSVSSDGMVSSSNNNAANGTSDPAVTSTSKPVPAIDKSSEKRQTSNSTVRPEPSLIEGLASDITFGQPTSLGRVPDRIASKCFIPNNARQINKSSFASSRPVQHSHNLKDPVDMMNATFLSMPANPIIKTGQPPNQQVFSSRTPTNTSDTGRSLTEIRGNYSTDHKYTPLDAAQANQNIKSLLEGAFDDNSDDEGDDDIPKDKNKEFTVDEDDLIGKLQQMSVKTKEEGVDVASRVGLTAPASTEDGLNVRLMPHQVDGVAWMVQKEKGGQKKRGASINGGILADDMGLGKTVQSIALILRNPLRRSGDQKPNSVAVPSGTSKCTLIIAPLALIKQWESEISTKVLPSHALSVLVHHGPSRTRSASILQRYDVVITTYHTLSSEFVSSRSSSGGDTGCMGVIWYRVILDEAHAIKNRNAKWTQASYTLKAHYRWCLTGTPMQNNLDELQSLIKFLRIKPYDDLKHWKEQISEPVRKGRGGVAIRRLQYFLKAVMKRRTKEVLKQKSLTTDNATNDAKNDFQIVGRTIETKYLDLTGNERQLYDQLASRADASLDKMMRAEKIDTMGALVLLLRLRQACNHSSLIRKNADIEKGALGNDLAFTRQGSDAVLDHEDAEGIDGIAKMMGKMKVKTASCDRCMATLTEDDAVGGESSLCLNCQQDISEIEEETTSVPLPRKHRSNGSQRRPVILESGDEGPGESDKEVSSHSQRQSDYDDPSSSNDTESPGKELSTKPDKKKASLHGDGKVVPSTKITALLDILHNEINDHKVIVFSFFTTMLDVIQYFLLQNSIPFTRYDGSMRNDAREESLKRLRDDSSIRVLLCSLKSGSLGLNLTAASRVVILEPFWNPFVEEQAIDRVHRLNQTKDVVVYKLLIKDTVEERILELQESKRKLANAATEGGKSMNKVSMKDIMRLFQRDAEYEDHAHRKSLDFGSKSAWLSSSVKKEEEQPVVRHGSSGEVHPPASKRAENSIYGRR